MVGSLSSLSPLQHLTTYLMASMMILRFCVRLQSGRYPNQGAVILLESLGEKPYLALA